MWLPDQVFKTVISSTPLISIDLVVRNEKGEVLLGKRLNAPAKGYWFVPGGLVQKNEILDQAFIRLLKQELGIESGMTGVDAEFLGVFEHFYDDKERTHYIVLAYEFFQMEIFLEKKQFQHLDYSSYLDQDLLNNREVYEYTKLYFRF